MRINRSRIVLGGVLGVVLLVVLIGHDPVFEVEDAQKGEHPPSSDTHTRSDPEKRSVPRRTAQAKAVVPVANLNSEADPVLQEWNKPYHEWRSRMRKSPPAKNIHTFYTIDCTHHSLWQVLTLEMTWERVEQGGVISRIVSGCDPTNKNKQADMGRSIIDTTNMGVYFTPTFHTLPNGEYYAPYNRPSSIWFWLNHTDLTEEVLVLLDPDMVYIKPLPVENVKKGHPVAQHYDYMQANVRMTQYRCSKCPEPGWNLDAYAVGPPWMLHIDDFRKIMPTWLDLVPMLKAQDPGAWIIEMVAYSVAMKYHEIPHEVIWAGMAHHGRQAKVFTEGVRNFTIVPSLLHYCFTFELGEKCPQGGGEEQMRRMIKREEDEQAPVINYFHWSKYRIPTDWPGGKGAYQQNILDCGCPLMMEFRTRNAIHDIETNVEIFRDTVFLDYMIPAFNEAIVKWRLMKCKPEEINYRKTLRTFHPAFYNSKYEILSVKDERTVTFRKVES